MRHQESTGYRARVASSRRLASAASLALALCLLDTLDSASAHARTPELRGDLQVVTWDAGRVATAGTSLRTRVYYPDAPGSYPLVGVIHGASGNGTYHPELASTLASRGMVVLVPDMPCTVFSCDHDANARQILGLLAWAAQESASSTSRLHARVDGSRRGLVGHSWGGLSSHLAAARSDTIQSLVLLDPNDSGTRGRDATATITAPTLQLMAATKGACNSAWRDAAVRERLGVPHLQVTLTGSGHCNPGEVDVACSIACGSGNSSTTPLFRRYAVAWTVCNLRGDHDMASWAGGAAFQADVSAGVLEGVHTSRLDALPCATGGAPDPHPDPDPPDASIDDPLDDATAPDQRDTGVDDAPAADVAAPEEPSEGADSLDPPRDVPSPGADPAGEGGGDALDSHPSSPELIAPEGGDAPPPASSGTSGCGALTGPPGAPGAQWPLWLLLLLGTVRTRRT